MELGLVKFWRKRWEIKDICEDPTAVQTSGTAIAIEDSFWLFVLLAVGVGVALLILSVEACCVIRRRNRKQREAKEKSDEGEKQRENVGMEIRKDLYTKGEGEKDLYVVGAREKGLPTGTEKTGDMAKPVELGMEMMVGIALGDVELGKGKGKGKGKNGAIDAAKETVVDKESEAPRQEETKGQATD
jgi:hypothetical protein